MYVLPRISIILTKYKKYGGLNLVDFVAKDDTLKISWIPYLLHDKLFHFFTTENICKVMAMDIWKCNLSVNDIEVLKIKNVFWKDVLLALCKYNFQMEITEPEDIFKQILWFNSHNRIGNKPVLFKNPFKDSLITFAQIVDLNGNLMPINSITIFLISRLCNVICLLLLFGNVGSK